jgi:hypothetical protein
MVEKTRSVASAIAREHFGDEIVNKALRNRRSDNSNEAVIRDFFTFEQPDHSVVRDEHYLKALKVCEEKFRPSRVLHPVAYPDLRYHDTTLPTNVGAPWNMPNHGAPIIDRNVDLESEIPRVSSPRDKAKWEEFFRYIKRVREDRNPTTGKYTELTTQDYLNLKQSFGLIENNRMIKSNLYPEMLVINRMLIHKIKDGQDPFWKDGKPVPYYWHTLFARAHTVDEDEDDKIRAVFGATFLLLQVELMFIWTLEKEYKEGETGRMLWNREIFTGGWKKIYQEIASANGLCNRSTVLGLDWSQFDKRVLHEMIDDIHIMWRRWFDFSKYEETSFYNGAESEIKDPTRIERLWDWMCYSVKSTPILLPDGRLFEWTRNGLASGFQQTQMLDSFVNAVMILTILSRMGINIESESFWFRVQGDDSVSSFLGNLRSEKKFKDEAEYYGKGYFNAKLNRDKTEIGTGKDFTNVKLLGYTQSYGIPHREEVDLLTKLFYPENEDDFSRMRQRTIGLAYANCGTNARFHAFCEDLIKRTSDDTKSRDAWKALRFMKMIFDMEDEDIKKMTEIPNVLVLLSRTRGGERLRGTKWPTAKRPKNDFYFL